MQIITKKRPEGGSPIELGEKLKSGRNKVAILDFGGQYLLNIDRRVRALGFETTVLPSNILPEELTKYSAMIMSGGPSFVNASDAPEYNPAILNLPIPTLGICYGMHVLAQTDGGIVGPGARREDGPSEIKINKESKLFGGLDTGQTVLMSHGDSVLQLPLGFSAIADSRGLIAAMENPERKKYGVQFHPEVDLTPNGNNILANFLLEIAELKPDFTLDNRHEKALEEIREQVGSRKVLALVSGGVDSTILAALLTEALGGDKVIAVHVDTGFMRKNESLEVKDALQKMGLELNIINAASHFFGEVGASIASEEKRKIIGTTFIDIVEDTIRNLGLGKDEVVVAQGTLRPDMIESASKLISSHASTIKTHHNNVPAVEAMRQKGSVVEPLKEYYKDEVRALGEELGLPDSVVWRQPFPGPGLAVRVIGSRNTFPEIDFDSQLAIQSELKQFESNDTRVTLLPIQSVGVQGDARTYKYLVGLSGKPNWQQLIELAREIPKNVQTVNRVVYVFGEPIKQDIVRGLSVAYLTPKVVDKLREADAVVNKTLEKYNLLRKLSQVPVILVPLNFGKDDNHSIAIRPIITKDFMTGVPPIPGKDIPEEAVDEMVDGVLSNVQGISRVMYDLTSKPPGTIEWE